MYQVKPARAVAKQIEGKTGCLVGILRKISRDGDAEAHVAVC
jgi:hypothetical protein